ncbi:hypothetical protein BJX76DRAFT_357313 [Aspergillus varians]
MGKNSDPQLRKAIRMSLLTLHKENRPIDQQAIKIRYTKKHPHLANYIHNIVKDYSAYLQKNTKVAKPTPIVQRSQNTVRQAAPVEVAASSSSSSDFTSEATAGECFSEDSTDSTDNSDEESHRAEDKKVPDNALMRDFREDLARKENEEKADSASSVMPSLEEQKQLLTSDDEDDRMTGVAASANLEHAALVSAKLEKDGCKMPSQFALLGKLKPASSTENANPDPRVVLNTNVPFSAFICGLQGSGKSHTTSCIIENCSMTMPILGNLRQSVSTLVLHFNEYSSNVNSQPSEAAFLASVLPKYVSQQKPLPLRVLVSPTNYQNLSKMYANIPNVEVRAFRIHPRHLNISMMLSLMSMSQADHMPLYMAQVLKVLRDMAIESGGSFNYTEFRRRLDKLGLDSKQTPFLAQRLDLLDSYLDLNGKGPGDYFVDGGITIFDLSCPFVDQSTACILFRIAIDLFLYAHPSRGKMIVADEAHKYMTDTPAAKELTETFLTIIRQQRHLGVRTIISTQEPTISPRLIDLCSITIIHRFTSPKWYETIRTHLPIEKRNVDEHGIPDALYDIASLRTGEAIVFAPSAQLVDAEGLSLDAKHHTFRLMVRKRITWDGGRTILSIR